MTTAQDGLVLGAEAALWTEIVSEEMLDARLWPRAAALAERFWSPAAVRDEAALARRLPVVQAELEILGNRAAADRHRMMARLAPDSLAPLATLLAVTTPVRNYALNHVFGPGHVAAASIPPALDRVADIATPDSFEAAAFTRDVAAYVDGQHDLAPGLRARLENWRDNDARLRQVVATRLALREALPASGQLAELACVGLYALDGTLAAHQVQVAAVLQAAQAQFAASASMLAVRNSPQPAGDLLQAITPAIAGLVQGHM